MLICMKEVLMEEIKKALTTLAIEAPEIVLEHPADLSNGDYSTSVALALSKKVGENPKALAEKIVTELNKNKPREISKVELAGPGFINFYLSPEFFTDSVA